jgi:hypothetical protein
MKLFCDCCDAPRSNGSAELCRACYRTQALWGLVYKGKLSEKECISIAEDFYHKVPMTPAQTRG